MGIVSRAATKEYIDNWGKVFRNRKKEVEDPLVDTLEVRAAFCLICQSYYPAPAGSFHKCETAED